MTKPTKLVRATVRYQRAHEALRKAEARREAADYALRDAHIEAERPVISAMTTPDLREHIADLARNHGMTSARAGRVTAYSWGPFRAALAELARRATR